MLEREKESVKRELINNNMRCFEIAMLAGKAGADRDKQ